ncbi:hypothetical protein F4819DRAFT_490060 [Hypoxylon fuscum]|nr:hypothetical protein F4819DRAFT_490060 [Hypoxylon fuscum]
MSTSRTELGLSCPSKGKFYTCENAKIRFVGCCAIDPCADGTGHCPQSSLATTSFSSDSYDHIPLQDCVAPYNSSNWYTCTGVQPFLGCCGINPCQSAGCPTAKLLPATLSSDADNAKVFLADIIPKASASPSIISAGGISSTAPSGSPSATSTSDSSTSSNSSGYILSLGGILGIAIGGTVIIGILFALLAYRCGWLRCKKHKKELERSTTYYCAQSRYSLGLSQWQREHRPNASEPNFRSPVYFPYSPDQYHRRHYVPPSRSLPDCWRTDSNHVSQTSKPSDWDPVIANKKHQPHALPFTTATGLDGQDIELPQLPMIAELPATPVKR